MTHVPYVIGIGTFFKSLSYTKRGSRGKSPKRTELLRYVGKLRATEAENLKYIALEHIISVRTIEFNTQVARPNSNVTATIFLQMLNLCNIYPAVEAVTMVRVCRRYRTVPLEAFVKGHLRVVSRATTKLFDG